GWRARAWLVVVLAPAVIVGAGGRGLPWEIPWTRARALLAGPERLRELAGRLVDFTASGRRLPARWAPSEALALQEKGSLRSLTVRISLMIEESVRLDRLAASQGYVPSNLALDDALGRGRRDLLGGGPPSLEERLEILGWLLQAAETGEPTAMLRLGQRLAWGWSYQGGHRMMTALLVHDGEMWDVLAREGAAWLRRAADAGDEEAIWELAGVRDVWPRRRRVTETPEAIAWCRRLAPAHPRARTVLLGLLAERPDLRLAADDAFLDHLPDDASVATADLAGLRPVLRLDPAASPEARAALHLLEHGLTDPARALAEQALARDPSDVLANNVMAVLYLRRGLARPTLGRGHVQAAASYLRRAERVRPGDLATELNLALCDVHEALTADRRSGPSGPAWLARRRLLLVSDLHPGDPIGTAIRATVEQLFADRKIREDVSLDDARGWHSSALKRVADARRAAGDLEGAITGYTEAIGHSTGNLDPRLARSEARAATGDLAGALEDLDEAVRLAAAREPGLRTDLATLERALVARGDVRLRAGDLTGALADFDAAQATSPRNRRWDAALGKARVLRRQGALAEADLALTRLLVGWPDFVDALLELADLRAALGEPERALPDQTRALAVLRAVADPGRLAQVHVERARTFVALGRLREAIDDCSRAVALAPTSTSALLLRGPLRALGGERAVGVEDLARAAELGAREAGLWLAWLTGDAARLNEAPGDGWEGALVRHARGELADDALLAAALQGADDAAPRLCVAACALDVVCASAGDRAARARPVGGPPPLGRARAWA
ncbi:MAG: hypothetical protein KIT58_12670, partial [Planctomycetota bacterium]|nr:hypothetical protein [Planctomycetota bacterium]